MYIIFAGIPFVGAYLYDLFSKSEKEHLDRLSQVFQLIAKHGLKLKISKFLFVQPKLELLGHVVDALGVSVEPSKIEAIPMVQVTITRLGCVACWV